MELRHLRYFVVVAEELHFKRAADRLHMEPQPLNFQIKQLERELGFPLLIRAENRTRLSAAGAAFLTDARSILAQVDRAVEHAGRVSRGETGMLRVGNWAFFSLTMLVPVIARFKQSNPEVTIELIHLNPSDQLLALARHDIDIGFDVLPLTDENLDSFVVGNQRLVAAMRNDHELASKSAISSDDLCGADMITFEPVAFAHLNAIVEAFLTTRCIPVSTVQVAGDLDSALAFVSAGMGMTLIPESEVQHRFSNLTFVDVIGQNDTTIGCVWRRDEEHPLRDRFLQLLSTHIEEQRTEAPHLVSDGV